MLDQNAIVEIINHSLPVAASSPVLVKLTSVVGEIIKTLYLPTLTLKKGKAEVDVELYRKQQLQDVFENQAFTLYEVTKLKNFLHAAGYAAEELNGSAEEYSEESVDFDWVMRFFDAVSNISNEDMQRLWGKILAGEIKKPGKCSLRTLDIVRNMSPKEAKTFSTLCGYVVHSGDCHFIFHNGFWGSGEWNERSKKYISERGLVYASHIIPMIECGLISVDNSLATDFKTDSTLVMYNPEVICFCIADQNMDSFLNVDTYFLTTCGIELFNILSSMDEFQYQTQYQICCFQEIKQMYPDLSIAAFRFEDGKMGDTDLLI